MTLVRWSRQYNIIDCTPARGAEEAFVRQWIHENRFVLHDVRVYGNTYTFKAINTVIGEFERDLYVFHSDDVRLQEMEEYFNEH